MNEIAVMFRKAELEKRKARRAELLRRIENEIKLENDEDGTDECREALAALQASHVRQQIELESQWGYWRRLWYALINRRV